MSNLINTAGRTKIQSMSSLIRYNNVFHIHDENVAEHSFYVALYTMELCNALEFPVYFKSLCIEKALIHDVHEIELSDIPNNIKVSIPELGEMCERYERDFNLREFPDLKERESRLPMVIKNVADIIVNLADVLSVYQYASQEIEYGNKIFVKIKENASLRIEMCLTKLEGIISEGDLKTIKDVIK